MTKTSLGLSASSSPHKRGRTYCNLFVPVMDSELRALRGIHGASATDSGQCLLLLCGERLRALSCSNSDVGCFALQYLKIPLLVQQVMWTITDPGCFLTVMKVNMKYSK